MVYSINCSNCKKNTKAANIVDLIVNHTETIGKIKCTACGSLNASIYKESNLQEKGETWIRYIRSLIPIKTNCDTYTPYVFLTSQTENGEIDGIHFNYYKDTRKYGGKLKHGHGPGGSPVFSKDDFFQLIKKLISYGCFNKQNFLDFIKGI